jgi:hypothetical protein
MSDASRGDSRPQTATTFNGHPVPEQIAAWIDEPELLDPAERRELDAHIADCRECQQVAADLRAIVAALASLAEIETPRSFALPVSEAPHAVPQPIVMTETRAWRERQLRVTRWATAIAAILLVLVLGVDLVTGNNGSNQAGTDATTMQMKSAPMSAAGAQANESTGSSASGGSGATEQERTTGEEAADTSRNASTPESGETFGFGADATPAADSAAGSVAAPDDATTGTTGAVDETPDASTLTTAQDTTAQGSNQTTASGDNRLGLIETGLAMLIVWLLIAMIAIPYLRGQSGNPR